MASTTTFPPVTAPHLLASLSSTDTSVVAEEAGPTISTSKTHDVVADFRYYKDPRDGSLPPPFYLGKSEATERSPEIRSLLVHDIRDEEDQYSLDKTGFQVYKHVSQETEFQDADQIKEKYYSEIEEILKSA